MALDSSRTHLRAITFLGAGAALLVVFGYLLMKSDRKKPKRKSSKPNTDEIDAEMESSFNLAIQASKNKQKILELSSKRTPIKQNFEINQPKIEIQSDDHMVPNLEEKTKTFTECLEQRIDLSTSETINLEIKIEHQQQHNNEADKLSETSSDSGQGQSEILANNDFDSSDSCLNNSNADNNSNFSDTKEIESECKTVEKIVHHFQSSSSELKQADKENDCVLNQVVPVKDDSLNHKSITSSSNNKNSSSRKSTKNSKSISNSDKRPINESSLKKKDLSPSTSTNSKTKQDSNKNISMNNKKIEEMTESIEKTSNQSDLKSNASYEDLVAYEFNFPRKFCGILIGKNGINVDTIRSETQTQIAVRNDPKSEEMQIVCVSGRLKDVDNALDIISMRFPVKQYPQISFKPISKPIVYRRYNPEKNAKNRFNETKVLVAPNMFVEITSLLAPKILNEINANPNDKLVINKSMNNNNPNQINVHVTAVVSASHIFIQIPTHPTYENLQKLDENMSSLYNNLVGQTNNIPFMVEPIEYGTICVAPTSYGWHRAMVTNYQSFEETCKEMPDFNENCGLATIKFLDYGGYLTLPVNQLRQLRSDFMNLPFQAVECYLDGVYPYPDTEEEGKNYLSNLIKGSNLTATIVGFAEDGIPLIKLFLANEEYENCSINEKIIQIGLAYQESELNFDHATEHHSEVPIHLQNS